MWTKVNISMENGMNVLRINTIKLIYYLWKEKGGFLVSRS